MKLFVAFTFSFLVLITACSSGVRKSEAPAWITQPTRTVDAGYIVYIGTGEDRVPERATFKAESMAIGDLANECSLAPKGARIEDRYDSVGEDGHHKVYAKLGVVFEECEDAKKALEPAEIRKLANVAMTEQLKKYQDLYYTPEEPAVSPVPPEGQKVATTGGGSPPPPPGGVMVIHDYPQYIVMREQVVYAKQNVILAPPTAYAPASPEYTRMVTTTTPSVNQLHQYEVSNPAVRTNPQTWSSVQHDPNVSLPAGTRRMRDGVARGADAPRSNPGHRAYRPPSVRRRRNHGR